MKLDDLITYNNILSDKHKYSSNSGYEINDRTIFINHILKPLGYDEKNLLQDVPQSGLVGSKSVDIRIFGNTEYKSKHSFSQFIVETKNYKSLCNLNNIDYLQLKRYIKYNESKIRLIVLTDYKQLYIFNATELKKSSKINFNNLSTISKIEEECFRAQILINIDLEIANEHTLNSLLILSYSKVFGEQKFINPNDFIDTNSINDPHVRKNFIFELYHLMIRLKNEIVPIFEVKLIDIHSQIGGLASTKIDSKKFKSMISNDDYLPILNYLLWGIEMNYLDDFFENNLSFDINKIENFLNDREKKDSFVLTSIYNIINKTMFLRILEDSSTSSTKFINGKINGRYISNGILEKKRKEGKINLIKYFIKIFNFEQEDLKPYSFILSKDIYNWILNSDDIIISELIIELIRLFNDINFKKINQDILGDIYEHYLEQEEDSTSKKTYRRLLGQYYTPKPIVRLMWYLTRDVLKRYSSRDLYENNEDYLKIIDPACGSGTFLSEAILHINEIACSKKINSDGKVFSFIKDRKNTKRIENSIYGLELNPLSKSIGDINLFFSLIQAYGNHSSEDIIRAINIYRTDSLDLNNDFRNDDDFEEKLIFLKDEIKYSRLHKYNLSKAKNQKYDIVIGNPPYGSSQTKNNIQNKLIPFALPENNFNTSGELIKYHIDNVKGTVPDNEKNTGKLNDLYAYFFGLSDSLCKEDGIISFITSNTYLTIPSYKWFRKYLLENYSIDYLINFNDVSEKSNSMFAPDAGIATSIIIMRKTAPKHNHVIKCLDISDKKDISDKFDAFCNINWSTTDSKLNKNHIKSFVIKPLDKINFINLNQNDFLNNKDYTFSMKNIKNKAILDKILFNSLSLSEKYETFRGIDIGDIIFVQDEIAAVKRIFNKIIVKKDLNLLKKTLKTHLISQFSKNKINLNFDDDKIVKYIFQKDMKAYGYNKLYYTYLDKNILWRSRISDNIPLKSNPIYSSIKLFILERRDKYQIISSVTDEMLVPQHGGRFMYVPSNNNVTKDELYLLSGIINSSIIQFYYKYRSLGNKNIIIPDLDSISSEQKYSIINLSKDIHNLNKILYDYSNINKELIISGNKYIKIDILTENDYWDIIFEDTLMINYEIENIKQTSTNLILNENIILQPKKKFDIKKLYKLINNYNGNLIESPLIIDLYSLLNTSEDFKSKINDEIAINIKKIDALVATIYDLSEEEYKIISNDRA